MREAIIGLAGVIIGGIIGLVGQFILARFDNKKWKKEKIIENLRIKRENLEKRYSKCIPELYKSIEKETFSAEMTFEIIHTFPKNVAESFRKFSYGNLNNQEKKKEAQKSVWDIIYEMKKSLSEIDEQIKLEIEK